MSRSLILVSCPLHFHHWRGLQSTRLQLVSEVGVGNLQKHIPRLKETFFSLETHMVLGTGPGEAEDQLFHAEPKHYPSGRSSGVPSAAAIVHSQEKSSENCLLPEAAVLGGEPEQQNGGKTSLWMLIQKATHFSLCSLSLQAFLLWGEDLNESLLSDSCGDPSAFVPFPYIFSSEDMFWPFDIQDLECILILCRGRGNTDSVLRAFLPGKHHYYRC